MILSFWTGLLHGALEGSQPPAGDLNSHTWIIITALAGVIASLAGVIVKLYKDLQKCEDRNRKFIDDQLSLMRTLRNEFDKPYP